MISVKELLYGIDFKLNSLTNLEHQEIPIENKIVALREAELKLIKTKMSPNNPLGIGFEASRKRYDDLQDIVEPPHKHKIALKKVDEHLGKWEADISKLSPEYMFFVSGYAIAKKGRCENVPIHLNEHLTKHADLTTVLNNSHQKPSFEYQETPCTLSSGKIEIYDDGTFNYSELFVSYLRYPKKIDFEGYFDLEGNPSVTQDSELPEYLKEELLNLVILELQSSLPDVQGWQISQARIKSQE